MREYSVLRGYGYVVRMDKARVVKRRWQAELPSNRFGGRIRQMNWLCEKLHGVVSEFSVDEQMD